MDEGKAVDQAASIVRDAANQRVADLALAGALTQRQQVEIGLVATGHCTWSFLANGRDAYLSPDGVTGLWYVDVPDQAMYRQDIPPADLWPLIKEIRAAWDR